MENEYCFNLCIFVGLLSVCVPPYAVCSVQAFFHQWLNGIANWWNEWKMLKSSIKLCFDSINVSLFFFFSSFYAYTFGFIEWRHQTMSSIDWENDKVIRMRILPILSFTFRQITDLPHIHLHSLCELFNEQMVYSNILTKAFHRIGNIVFSFHFHSISWMTKLNRIDAELPIIVIIIIIIIIRII